MWSSVVYKLYITEPYGLLLWKGICVHCCGVDIAYWWLSDWTHLQWALHMQRVRPFSAWGVAMPLFPNDFGRTCYQKILFRVTLSEICCNDSLHNLRVITGDGPLSWVWRLWRLGQKYEFAVKWKINVVNPRWLNDSLKAGYSLPEVSYHVNNSTASRSGLTTSTPTNDTS